MRHKVVVVMLSPHNAATRNLHVLTLQHYNFAKLLCGTLMFCMLQVNVKIIKIKVECKVQNKFSLLWGEAQLCLP